MLDCLLITGVYSHSIDTTEIFKIYFDIIQDRCALSEVLFSFVGSFQQGRNR